MKKAFFAAPEKWLEDQDLLALLPAIKSLLSDREVYIAQLSELKEQAGITSRMIGERKKSGESVDGLIAEMKAYKATMKTLASDIDTIEQQILSLVADAAESVEQEKEAAHPEKIAAANYDYSLLDVQLLSSATKDACLAYLQQSCDSSVYHYPAWCELIETTFKHSCYYLVAVIKEEVVGVLPLVILKSRLFGDFGVSMPYFNYGGPIGHADEVIDALLVAAEAIAVDEKVAHLEYRCLQPLPKYPGHENKVSMWLDLPPTPDELWQSIGTKVRAQVKKARVNNFTAHIGGEELLDDFYTVFAINMRDLGTPVYAKSFFREVLRIETGKKHLVVLKNENSEPISVALLLGSGSRMEVPWASTLRRYNSTNANMLLYWNMLEFACQQQYTIFDFGRSSVGASTHKFKRQWGAKPVQLYWHYWLARGGELPQLNPNNPKYKLVIWLWQKLPVWLTKFIGPHIVKYLP